MSTILLTLYRLNHAEHSLLDLPYSSLPAMSLPADSMATITDLLPYARLLCFLIAGLVFVLRRTPNHPTGLNLLFIHRTREHHMHSAAYDSHIHSDSTCLLCKKAFNSESSVTVLHREHCFHPNCLATWLDEYRGCPTCGVAVPEPLVWPIDSWTYAVPYWLRAVVCAHHSWLDALFVVMSAVLLLLELTLCVVGEGSVTALLLEALTLRNAYQQSLCR